MLKPFLRGTTRVRVATFGDERVVVDEEIAFDSSPDRVAFVDETGAPYSIDKVGHLTRSFEETSSGVKAELLDATLTVLRELKERCGVEAYLCYGALLGAVRQGTMLGHDSDVDVCYYSAHDAPVDLIAESYRIQRAAGAGLDGAADVGRRHQGDLAALGRQQRPHRHLLRVHDQRRLLPVRQPERVVRRRGQPAPARHHRARGRHLPGAEGSRGHARLHLRREVARPGPRFRYQDNPLGTRRLDGWFRGFRTEVPLWQPIFSPTLERIPTTGSDFATWVAPQLGEGDQVADLGAGSGRDSFYFGSLGHPVLAMDYSRPAIGSMRRRKEELDDQQVTVELLVLNEARLVMALIVALTLDPHHLYARGLIGSLDEEARRHLFRLASTTLRSGGKKLFLEFSAAVEGEELPEPGPQGLTRRFDPAWLQGEIEAYGGTVELCEVAPGLDMYDDPDPAVARMRVSWSR